MDCRRAKTGLALWVGDDLPEATVVVALQRHVARCPACASYLRQLQASHEALRSTQPTSPVFVSSVWPQVRATIVRREKESRVARFNGWIPAVAMAATVLVIVGVSVGPQVGSPQQAPSVGFQGAWNQRGALSRDLFRTDPQFQNLTPIDRLRGPQPQLQNAVAPIPKPKSVEPGW